MRDNEGGIRDKKKRKVGIEKRGRGVLCSKMEPSQNESIVPFLIVWLPAAAFRSDMIARAQIEIQSVEFVKYHGGAEC
jgi:hypothetical protein